MSIEVERAQERVVRADKLLRAGKILLNAYLIAASAVIIGLLLVVIQTQQVALDQSIRDNAVQHAKTQEYIKCVAGALLVPLSQRSANVFDQCGIDAQRPTTDTPTQQSPSVQPPSAPQAVQPTPTQVPAPAAQQPTTSSPPDPTPEQDETGFVRGVVDAVLRLPRFLLGTNQ